MEHPSQSAAQEEMSAPKQTVLIVEDDAGNAATLDLLLLCSSEVGTKRQ